MTVFLGSDRQPSDAPPRVTASKAQNVRAGSNWYSPSFVWGKLSSPLAKFGRFFVKAHSKFEAEATGPRTSLDASLPKSTALRIKCPILFNRKGIVTPCCGNANTSRGKPNFPPSASMAPLRKTAGVSASTANAVISPFPAIHPGISAVRRSSPRR